MLAKDAPEDLSTLSYPLIVQPKLDGIRCSIVDGVPVSRTLKQIPNREIFDALSDPRLTGLDGELIVGDPTDQGCMQRTTSFVMAADKTGEPWAFHAFDHWSAAEAEIGNRYIGVVCASTVLPERIVRVSTVSVSNESELLSYESAMIDAGYEGLILRDPSAPYKFGRSGKKGPLLKLKRFIDYEAEIIGVYEELHNGNEAKTNALGRTERSNHKVNKAGKGTLGGFELRAINGPYQGVEFRCGTGFTAEQRTDFWLQDRWLLGQTVKVKSFPTGVKDKPRHPVFLGFRDTEVDG